MSDLHICSRKLKVNKTNRKNLFFIVLHLILISCLLLVSKMSLSWIKKTARFEKGIQAINAIDVKKFSILLNIIVDNTQHAGETLTAEEVDKLKNSLKLDDEQISSLLYVIRYLVVRLWVIMMKPKELQEQLENEYGLEKNKAELFLKTWTNDAKDIFASKSCHHVSSVIWEIRMRITPEQFDKNDLDVNKSLVAYLQFLTLENERVTLEMDHKDVSLLFDELNKIQIILDEIKGKKS